jgi:type IV secretory pathway ATPase VirB11/archaellum biosynthesis ATPase
VTWDPIVREIKALNQRGGRMLSVVDLLDAGTLDLRLAAYLMRVIGGGASILACAGPGGTGKTTLMAALLCFLPSNGRIQVVEKAEPLSWYEEQTDPQIPT